MHVCRLWISSRSECYSKSGLSRVYSLPLPSMRGSYGVTKIGDEWIISHYLIQTVCVAVLLWRSEVTGSWVQAAARQRVQDGSCYICCRFRNDNYRDVFIISAFIFISALAGMSEPLDSLSLHNTSAKVYLKGLLTWLTSFRVPERHFYSSTVCPQNLKQTPLPEWSWAHKIFHMRCKPGQTDVFQ